jgi:hypothetical protein
MTDNHDQRPRRTAPRWVNIVGGLGILFGCLGILGAGQSMAMPQMFAMQKRMIESMQTMRPASASAPVPIPPPELMKLLEFPEWYQTWSVVMGIVALAVAAFYLYAAIRLLQVAPDAVRLFRLAAAVAIVAALVKGAVGYNAGGMVSVSAIPGSIFSIVVNSVLLAVIATADHSAFSRRDPA